MPYCTTNDLLIGDIPTSGALDPAKYVEDAADEIDSKIGFVYATPIDTANAPRPVTLLLKRLNSHLASGRLILAATIPAEDKELNAYGQSLVEEVELTLDAIAKGTILLPQTPVLDPAAGGTGIPARKVSMISNGDTESAVDAFYDRVANPNYQFPDRLPPSYVIPPTGGGLVSG